MGANLLTYIISAIYLSLGCLHTQAYTPEGILATHKCYTFKIILSASHAQVQTISNKLQLYLQQ